jgi:hypothetical protein
MLGREQFRCFQNHIILKEALEYECRYIFSKTDIKSQFSMLDLTKRFEQNLPKIPSTAFILIRSLV